MTTRAEKYKKEILEKLKKQYESRSFKDAPFSTEINMIFSQVDELQSTITQQAGLIRRLKETSKDYWTYMQHRKGCASIIKQVHKRGECNCGFFELNNKFTALMNELEKREG
jgi:hypothetical protein